MSEDNTIKTAEKLDIQHVESNNLDYDAQKLQDLGYKQEFKRETSLFVQAGFAFTTMGVLPNWLVGFGPSISAGGPSSLFWGWVVVAPFVCCIALSMAEIISVYPLEGGVFSWSLLLSNKKWGPFMSYINGYLYLTGLITANITLAYSAADFIIYTANTLNITQISSTGANVGLYIGIFIAATAFNFLGMRSSNNMNKFLVFWVAIGTIVILCVVPAMAPTHNTAKWVFTEFTNNTGYENVGLVFFIGMLQAGWTLVGYETGAQIVEGTKRADVAAPRGIIICVAFAVLQGFVIILVTLFSIQDVQELMTSDMPLSTFFVRATNSPQLTAFFLVILLVAQLGSLCNSMLAAGHFAFALARDGCLPYSKYFSKLSEKEHVPQRALIAQLVISILVILPTFGSIIYWHAIMSAAVIAINVSYGMPFLCRLIWVRNDMPKGPFNLGKFGIPLNIISVVWIIFFSVVLCIPSVSPVSPESMNWSSIMLGGVMIFSLIFWFVSGRKNHRGFLDDADQKE
ncbi:hypothetical protein INT47_012955 [Mucor saturninus]|uniref:Uncharacterized protein n=1 Tax=Mucor saturninus TaxID=64648 RepID=A0A8H7QXE2_9FUNG|nr:hypothetical protein INT47_012955 [Mucor saturninus]